VVTPLRITLSGKRTVFDPEAKAYDVVSCCPLAEYGRKVRTLAGNYQLLRYVPSAIVPWKNPVFVQFVSHKLCRLFVPWALLSLFVSNLFMLQGIYVLTFLMQAAWYMCAGAGYLLSKREIVSPVLIADEGRRAA
jgi:hypothetical protein